MELYGREGLVAHLLATIDACTSTRSRRVINVIGGPGLGKTSLFLRLQRDLESRPGLVVFTASATENSRHIAGSGLRQMLAAAWPLLSSTHRDAVSGLEALAPYADDGISSEDLATGFARLVEGLSGDLPPLILIDDTQWCDDLTAAAVERVASTPSAAFAIPILFGRDHGRRFTGDVLQLEPLDRNAAKMLARSVYSDAPESVISMIAEASGGVPFDAIVLAQQAAAHGVEDVAELDGSVTATIRSALGRLSEEARTLIQLCVLLEEPYSYELIRLLCPERTVETLRQIVPQYLIQRDDGFRFTHDRLRYAIASEAGVRPDLDLLALRAVQSLPASSLSDVRGAARLATRLGLLDDAYQLALRAAAISEAQEAWELAAQFFSIAIHLNGDRFYSSPETCVRYADCLVLLERNEELRGVLVRAIANVNRNGLQNSALARHLVNCIFTLEGLEPALSLCEELESTAHDLQDRLELQSTALNLRAICGDETVFEEAAFEESLRKGSLTTRRRLLVARALRNALRGNDGMALGDLARVELLSSEQSVGADYLDFYRAALAWHSRGPADALQLLRTRGSKVSSSGYVAALQVLAQVLVGELDEAFATLQYLDQAFAPGMLTAPAAIGGAIAACLGIATPEVHRIVERHAESARRFAEDTDAFEILFWNSLLQRVNEREQQRLQVWLSRAPARHMGLSPLEFGVALFEKVYGVQIALKPAASSRWREAGRDVHLGGADNHKLRMAAAAFERLGAATIAQYLRSRETSEPPPERRLTSRELQVARLVAEGLTNRDIASRLFVSERTVATHVSNALAKMDAKTRTELARKLDT